MTRRSWILAVAGAALLTSAAWAGTFGKAVSIGGAAADVALDEVRGKLYIANFTANRIDVMSLATNTIQTSINVGAQPSSIAISPDGHWLVVAQYGNNTAPASPTNGLTVIDLTANNSKQTYALANPPLGVAFGADGFALVVTATNFLLFDPTQGTTQVLQTIAQVATNAIPQPTVSFPPNIVQASIAASRDGSVIAGFGGSSPFLLFRYTVADHGITSTFGTATPAAGPRVVSVADDGNLWTYAWFVMDANFDSHGQFGNVAGLLNVGSTLIDSSRNLLYAQIPVNGTPATANTNPPILMILDAGNLTLRDQLQLPENLAGKSVLTNDHNTMYAISDSGVLVLPVGNLSASPRLTASTEDLVFRGNFCDRNVIQKTLTITDPGGGKTPFTVSASTAGVRVTPSSGTTPATVTVTIDPNAFASQKGTAQATLTIASSAAVNVPQPVRILINSQDPSQRGVFIDVPGKLVDLLADPKRNVYYVLRQDKNQLLVFNAANNTQTVPPLPTCTTPMGMAITYDQQDLLIGCDNSQSIYVYDLDTLQLQPLIGNGQDYVESLAVSSNSIFAMIRSGAGKDPGIDQVDLVNHVLTRLPTLGVYTNKLPQDTVLASSANGSHILLASSDGSMMIYDANTASFTVSRKDYTAWGGAYAASILDQYVVGTQLLDSSGVSQGAFTGSGSSSGFAFVTGGGYYTSTPDLASPGVISQVDLTSGGLIQSTTMVEAPILGAASSGSSGSGGSKANCAAGTNCTTLLFAPSVTTAWTRSLAVLPNQAGLVSLSTSGLVLLPLNYAAAVTQPQISKVVSAADGTSAPAPGGLISVLGSQLAATNLASSGTPLPTTLGSSCLAVNGQPMPIIFVSSSKINAQMPSQALGNVTMTLHTPGGVSDNFNLTVPPSSPAVFLSGIAGPVSNLPTVVRNDNGLLVTDSNPVHRGDTLTVYLTGLGATSPSVGDGQASPLSPLAVTVVTPDVQLGGTELPVVFSGLTPGEVGVYQLNVNVPTSAPTGLGIPLSIAQGGSVVSVNVRVIN